MRSADRRSPALARSRRRLVPSARTLKTPASTSGLRSAREHDRFPGRRGLRQRVARKQPALAGTIRAHAHELPVPELAAEDDPAPARLPRGRLAVVGLMSG